MTTLPYVWAWAASFLITLVVELVVAGSILRCAEWTRWRRYGCIAVANLATHPMVWFVFPALPIPYFGIVILAEAWAVVLEAIAYRLALPASPRWCPLAASALANGASYCVGLVVLALAFR
jgi:hypothetical protein